MGQALFGKEKDTKELIKENQRLIKKAIRELDKEIRNIENEEKKSISEAKILGKKNQKGALQIKAKDIIRARNFIKKMYEMKSHLSGMAMKMQTVKSNESMVSAMRGMTKAMKGMNTTFDMSALQKIAREFMTENEKNEILQETIGDAMDDALDTGDAEEEDSLVSEILDEIGISLGDNAPNTKGLATPVNKNAPATATAAAEEEVPSSPDMLALEERFNNLKK